MAHINFQSKDSALNFLNYLKEEGAKDIHFNYWIDPEHVIYTVSWMA